MVIFLDASLSCGMTGSVSNLPRNVQGLHRPRRHNRHHDWKLCTLPYLVLRRLLLHISFEGHIVPLHMSCRSEGKKKKTDHEDG